MPFYEGVPSKPPERTLIGPSPRNASANVPMN
jgi:hypothetical protein